MVLHTNILDLGWNNFVDLPIKKYIFLTNFVENLIMRKLMCIMFIKNKYKFEKYDFN